MSGEISDISQFCEYGWHDWVKFRKEIVTYLNDNPVLGRYLGLSIDVSPALAAKVSKVNGQVVHSSTYRALTPDEYKSFIEKAFNDQFVLSITGKLGAAQQ